MAKNDFDDAADWLDEEIGYDVQELSMLCLREFVNLSPVDTGRFRSNWIVSVDSESMRTRDSVTADSYKLGRDTIRRAVKKASAFDYVMIQNNLSYSAVLDDGLYPSPPKNGSYVKGEGYVKLSANGYSKQAPLGITTPGIKAALDLAKGR